MYWSVLTIFIASASASIYKDSECPVVKVADNFNLTAYGNGIWYEVAKYPNAAETAGNCGYAEYKLVGNVIKLKNVHVENNELKYIEGTAELAEDAGKTGKLVYTLPYGACGAEEKFVLNVLFTDYTNYAIVYHCYYDEVKKVRQDFAWIFSRTKFLPNHIMSKVYDEIEGSDILEGNKFLWPDFSEGACNIEPVRR